MGFFDLFGPPNVEKMLAKKDVEGLIKALQFKEPDIRAKAADAIGKIAHYATSAVDPLIATLKDSSTDVRRATAETLGKIGNTRAFEPLTTALKDTDSNVRKAATEACQKQVRSLVDELSQESKCNKARTVLSGLGNVAVTALVEAVADRKAEWEWQAAEKELASLDAERRNMIYSLIERLGGNYGNATSILEQLPLDARQLIANMFFLKLSNDQMQRKRIAAMALLCEMLPKIGDVNAVHFLISMLKDINIGVRKEAVLALAQIGDGRAVESLVSALRDKDKDMREAAAKALEKLNPDWPKTEEAKKQVPQFIASLCDKDKDVREKAKLAIIKIGDASAVEPLIAILKHSNDDVREAAVEALGEIGDARVVDPLISELTNWFVRETAIKSLVKIGGESVVEPLISSLKDKHEYVRSAAAEVLEKINSDWTRSKKATQQIPEFISALMDDDKGVRKTAAEVLGKIGDAHAVEPLIVALTDEEGVVRQAAAKALCKIGDLRAAEGVIEYLFHTATAVGGSHNLLGDYAHFIDNLVDYSRYRGNSITTSSPEEKHSSGRIEYDLQARDKATNELCKINTQISNNILHKIIQQNDIKVCVGWSCAFDSYGTLSFESQREKAKNELTRRGNPPYDPSAYLNKDAWKL